LSAGCGCHSVNFEGLDPAYKRALVFVIIINAVMFLIEMPMGFVGNSQALKADALDFLADTLTYGISLYVIGKAGHIRAKVAMLYCETNESIAAYSVGVHRHQPEMDDLVGRISGKRVTTLFTPHLTPMDRGILSTIYVRGKGSSAELMECWKETYAKSAFVNVVDHLPATKHVSGTNFVQMSARDAGSRIVLLSAIDNLSKGASGAAIQNMNVMFDLPETAGLA